MANIKMTRAEALAIAIETVENEEAVEVLRKMYAQVTKPRKKSNTPSKARRDNEAAAKVLADAIREHGAPVTTKWVTEHITGILTPQKAVAVAKVAEDMGLLTRDKDGKTTVYTLV